MTKAKALTPNSKGSTPKDTLRGVKNTPIKKNHSPKFKVTPTGKVPVINGSTPKGKMNKNTPKGAGNFHNSPKNQKNSPQKQNSPQNRQKSLNDKKSPNAQKTPQGEKNGSSGKSPELSRKLSEQQLKAKVAQLMEVEDNSDDSDDDQDINEGVEINEDISEEDSEDDDDAESESDNTGVKDILGNSLADSSDDDDVDFDEEDDEDDDDEDDTAEVVNKGVKMFQGLTAATDEEDDDEGNQSGPGLKSLLGNSLADDDDDDEDFEEGNEDDEDEDISDEDDEDEDEDVGSPINEKNVGEDDSDEDSEDDEDDAETAKFVKMDKDVKEESSDNDDDEGNEEKPRLTQEENEERAKRTIFIGNVPKETEKSKLKHIFRKFGIIECIRLRGVIPKDPKIPLKVAAITKKYHQKMTTLNAFITFKEQESAVKALAMNGQKFNDHFLRVDLAKSDVKPDQKKAVFLGNLPFSEYNLLYYSHSKHKHFNSSNSQEKPYQYLINPYYCMLSGPWVYLVISG